jgi:hypothetical protein
MYAFSVLILVFVIVPHLEYCSSNIYFVFSQSHDLTEAAATPAPSTKFSWKVSAALGAAVLSRQVESHESPEFAHFSLYSKT